MAASVMRKISKFTSNDLIITDQSLREPYRRRENQEKTAIHWGQRKLHLSEVEFFSIYWNPQVIPNPLCVYAGAAPGIHIELLSKMFPAFTFHLYDPANFDIEQSDRIRLFKEYFTDEVAGRYSGRNDVFFVSDIRTADYKSILNEALEVRGITEFNDDGTPKGPYGIIKEANKEAEVKNEDQIWGDMNMQQSWVLIMNPEHALLKFRLPYVLDGNEKIVQYLKGIVFWQVWAPQTSTETRLKPIKNDLGVYELSDWNTLEYEQWCFYHNIGEREQYSYINPFTDTNDPIDFPELLNDYDSTAEAFILRLYLEKFGASGDIYTDVKRLSRLTTLSINHYRTDSKGAKSLSDKRQSPIKSTSKFAIDSFRSKQTGKPLKHTAFKHTKVDYNQSWRQNPTEQPRSPPVNPSTLPNFSSNIIAPSKSPSSLTLPKTPSNIIAPPKPPSNIIAPVKSPTTITPPVKSPTTITPPVKSPTTITPPVKSPTNLVTPTRIITPPVKSPTNLVTPTRITPTTIPQPTSSKIITPPIRSPTNLVTPTRIIPTTIPQPTTSSLLQQPTRITPISTTQPIRNPSGLSQPITPTAVSQTVRSPTGLPQLITPTAIPQPIRSPTGLPRPIIPAAIPQPIRSPTGLSQPITPTAIPQSIRSPTGLPQVVKSPIGLPPVITPISTHNQ